MENARELDLDTLVGDVLSGRQSVEAARQQIAGYADLFGKGDNEENLDRRTHLAHAISRHMGQLWTEESAGRALDLARLCGDAAGLVAPTLERFVNLTAATRLIELGSHTFARDLLEEARAVREGTDPADDVAIECQWLRCLSRLGETEALTRDLPPALKLVRERGDERDLILLLELEARVLGPRDPSKALQSIDEAIQRRARLDPESLPRSFVPLRDEVELWATRGEVTRAAGRFEEALRSYERARELSGQSEIDRAAAYMLSEIGITWQLAGEPQRASEVLRQAAAEAERLGDRRAVLRWTLQLAGDLHEGEFRASDTLANAIRMAQREKLDFEAAFAAARRAIRQADEERLPEVEIMARNLLGHLYGRKRDFNRARGAIEEALYLAREKGVRNLELVLLLNLSMILCDLKALAAAQERLEEAIVLGERLRSETRSGELRKTLTGRLVSAYELLMRLYLGWSHEDGSPAQKPDPDRLLRLSQQAQAVNLAGWLAFETASEALQDPEVREAARAFREAEVRIERAATARASLGLLLEERDRRERRLAAALAAAGHPQSARTAPVIGLSELSAGLPPRALFVDLFAADHYVSFVSFSGEGAPQCGAIPWGREERLEFLDRWEMALASARSVLIAEGDVRGWRLQEDARAGRLVPAAAPGAADDLDLLLAELHDSFLQPLFEAVLKEEGPPATLYLSPHRELYDLPFWALSGSLPETCFSIVPSAGCLPLLAKRVRGPAAHRFKIGDATGSLPFSQLELNALSHYESLPARLDAILEHAPETGMLHFAGHGLFDGVNPYDSGLIIEGALPPGADPEIFSLDPHSDPPRRRLTVTGILSALELSRCSLVVLSACCTGLPQLHPSSEFTSLPAAFLVAGARTVIASLWPTHDGATALLMQEFYANLGPAGDRMPPSAALHAARQHLARMSRQEVVDRLGTAAVIPRQEQPFASPMYTMPFQCYGLE